MEKRTIYLVNFREIDNGDTNIVMELTQGELALLYCLEELGLFHFSCSASYAKKINPGEYFNKK